MTRQEVYRDIEDEFGFVPDFIKSIPDDTLENDWKTMKIEEFDEGLLPLKYKHLIGIGVSGAIKCSYCTAFHTEMAKASGATVAEINEALRYAMSTTGWSTFINGLQLDIDEFKSDLRRIAKFRKRKMERMEKMEKIAI